MQWFANLINRLWRSAPSVPLPLYSFFEQSHQHFAFLFQPMNFLHREDTAAFSVLIAGICPSGMSSVTCNTRAWFCIRAALSRVLHTAWKVGYLSVNSNVNCCASSRWQLSFRFLVISQHFEVKPAYLYHQSSGWCTPFVVAVVVGCYLDYLFTGGHVQPAFNCNIQSEIIITLMQNMKSSVSTFVPCGRQQRVPQTSN